MKLNIKDKIFTDNSKEASKDSTFVISKYNEKYKQNAINNGCHNFIDSSSLKKYLNMDKIKIIGITGTNGKTTTATLIYKILLCLGYKVALQGTRGFFINEEIIQNYTLTTPMQIGNFANIQTALNNNCDFFVMEVSSHAIDQNRIEGLDFSLKIHTNITRDHLDYHKTIQEYINVKNSFLSDDSFKLINIDDENVKFNPNNSFTYSLNNNSNYKVTNYNLDNFMNVNFSFLQENYSFESSMMGIFNIYNIMASISAVHILTKKELKSICKTLKDIASVSGRMEVISKNPLIIVDFAHTPDGMQEVLKSFTNKEIICVFGAGGNRDKEKRPLMGKVAERYSKHIIITSDNPRNENPNEIIQDIQSGISNLENVTIIVQRQEAIKKAISLANNNSVILILGKGDESTQIIGDNKINFSDKDEILKLLS